MVAVDGAELDVARGEIVALLGPSGCGKTTLLRTIAGFERPDGGAIEIGGRPVAGCGAWLPPEARGVGMVFQDYALFPHLTVAENVGFGLPRRERARRVPALLALVDLCGLGGRYPHELSGGQQQRVALARALAPAPAIVLLDEPWSNVDPQLRAELRDEVSSVLRPLRVTAILVTHDREEAFSLADRIALMRDGAIVQVGTPEELYFAPANRWAAEFVGAGNVLAGPVAAGAVHTSIGVLPRRTASPVPSRCSCGPSWSRSPPTRRAGRGRRARVPRARRLLPGSGGRGRGRLAAALERGRAARGARRRPPARRARRGSRLGDSLVVRCALQK